MTPQSIITTARQLINDNDSLGFRQTNDELLRYVNDGIREASLLESKYFYTSGNFQCLQSQTEQTVTFADAQKLIDVLRIKDGSQVFQTSIAAIAQFNPNWSSDPEGAAQNWARYEGDPLRFYIYPKAPNMQLLEVIYVRNPAVYALNDPIGEIPQSWESAIADYVIYRAESKDDEHTVSGRAMASYSSFKSKITGEMPVQQGAN